MAFFGIVTADFGKTGLLLRKLKKGDLCRFSAAVYGSSLCCIVRVCFIAENLASLILCGCAED